MKTIKDIEEEFDREFSVFGNGELPLCKFNLREAKEFLRSKLLEVAKSIVPERATERNNCKVSETWELHGVEEIDGWNACVSQISDNIEKL